MILIQSALLLLATVSSTPNVPLEMKSYAIQIANTAISSANQEILRLNNMPKTTKDLSRKEINNPQPSTGSVEIPDSSYTIEIVSPMRGTGLDRGPGYKFIASPTSELLENYVEIGAVLRDSNGNVIKDEEMNILASDSEGNTIEKTLKGTSTFSRKVGDFVYVFRYEFKTKGDHRISFASQGVTATITLTAE